MALTLGHELRRLERLYGESLGTIDQIVRAIARRDHLSADAAEDLSRSVRLKIVEHDYEVLRRFKRRSTLRTYLAVVVERHLLDVRSPARGNGRDSAVPHAISAKSSEPRVSRGDR